MERKQKSFRHSFEHQMLRDYYMKNPMDFVDTMGRDHTLYRVYDAICRERGEENLYRPEDYSADMLATPNGVKALRLTMLIRLRQFGLLDYHPIEEYLDKTVPGSC